MLVSLNPFRLYELVKKYAQVEDKYVLVIDNTNWFNLDSAKQTQVKDYHTEIPIDEVGEIFSNRITCYAFDTQSIATDTAHTWLPKNTDLADKDFFIECYVITPSGGIPYTNDDVENPNPDPG